MFVTRHAESLSILLPGLSILVVLLFGIERTFLLLNNDVGDHTHSPLVAVTFLRLLEHPEKYFHVLIVDHSGLP